MTSEARSENVTQLFPYSLGTFRPGTQSPVMRKPNQPYRVVTSGVCT